MTTCIEKGQSSGFGKAKHGSYPSVGVVDINIALIPVSALPLII